MDSQLEVIFKDGKRFYFDNNIDWLRYANNTDKAILCKIEKASFNNKSIDIIDFPNDFIHQITKLVCKVNSDREIESDDLDVIEGCAISFYGIEYIIQKYYDRGYICISLKPNKDKILLIGLRFEDDDEYNRRKSITFAEKYNISDIKNIKEWKKKLDDEFSKLDLK